MEDIKQQFEANFLDGEKIEDCGSGIFSVRGTLEVAEYFYDLAVKQEQERIGNVVVPIAQKFIDKVESGRARSIETYQDMKILINLINNN